MFDKLSEIGAYELYFDGIETYTLRFIDLMKSGECFQGNNLDQVIKVAVKFGTDIKWLNEEIPTPKKYITLPKRRSTTRAVDASPVGA